MQQHVPSRQNYPAGSDLPKTSDYKVPVLPKAELQDQAPGVDAVPDRDQYLHQLPHEPSQYDVLPYITERHFHL